MSGPILFGNYELLERIAEGGMAEVWRARSRGVAGFEKTVVIKRVLPSLLQRPGFAELLIREAKIAARLSHPNVIQIFDLGEVDGSYFIAMEYLRGRDLAGGLSYRASGETPLRLPLRLWIASEVAKALDYAHRAKGEDGKPLSIVHRDVSPQNVLLGFEGEVKVADFGIARADEPGLGRGEDPKILRGKYAYMSPEQARGEPLDRRSDIFSFGILLYELVSRRRMFRGRTSQETLELVRASQLPEYKKTVPMESLVPILERCLAPERGERFGSAGEIHEALNRLLFTLGDPTGQSELSRVMTQMFPPTDHVSPNKLRVDLLIRAYDDATAASDPGRVHGEVEATAPGTARTAALPTSKRLQRESRRLAFFVAGLRPGDDVTFDSSVEETGGSVLPHIRGMRVAAFGVAGMERAVGHAARCALEMRRRSRLEGPARLDPSPPMAIVSGQGAILEGVAVEADPEVIERAAALLRRTDPNEIRVASVLRRELGRDFRYRAVEDDLSIEGFRSRRDRDAGEMRRRAPLVGRAAVLRALSGYLLDASRGEGSVVHLIGEPGVGKSRLLAELRAAAAPQDFVFVQGRADEADTERSFGALADLVQDICGVEPEDAPAQRFEKVERMRVLGLLPREVRLLGELVGLAYPLPSGARIGRPRGIELALSIRRALRALARDRVVVIAIEDLQWMDDATRQVLPLLTDGLVESRVLVLVTRRPGSGGSLPAGSRAVEVPPLDRIATGRLLSHWLGIRTVEPELAELVRSETGGIPAWIELVAEALQDRVAVTDGVARLDGDVPVAVPDSVRSVVAARIERLRPTDRGLLRVTAALGGTVDVSLLSAVEGLIGHTERPALRRLLVRHLLVSEDSASPPPERLGAWGGDEEDERLPTRVRVTSDLLRRAVLAELEESEIERLNARIVATLERLGVGGSLDGLERLAHHAARSVDRRRAPDYLARAAQAAREEGLRDRAAEHLARAAAILREDTGDAADLRAFELALGAGDDALSVGALDLASRVLEPLRAAASRIDEPELALRFAMLEARCARSRLCAREALEALERASFDVGVELRTRARLLHGWTLLEAGETERAVDVLEAAAAEASGVPEGRALASWGLALARADRLDEADDAVSRALAVAARTGAVDLRYASLAAMAAVAEARGDTKDAAARYAEAIEVALMTDGEVEIPALAAQAAVAALDAGDDAAATSRAEEAERFAIGTRHEGWERVASAIKAALATRADPGTSLVPGIVRAVDRLEELGRPLEAAFALAMLAYAHLALGDPGAAGRTLERAAGAATEAGHRSLARRLRERARAALDSPDPPP